MVQIAGCHSTIPLVAFYIISASTITVTSSGYCKTTYDPVAISSIRDVQPSTGCCIGTILVNANNGAMPAIEMKLENSKCVRIAERITQAKERDEAMTICWIESDNKHPRVDDGAAGIGSEQKCE